MTLLSTGISNYFLIFSNFPLSQEKQKERRFLIYTSGYKFNNTMQRISNILLADYSTIIAIYKILLSFYVFYIAIYKNMCYTEAAKVNIRQPLHHSERIGILQW